MRSCKKIWIITIWLCVVGIFGVNAQDIHFSQFYASPLTLNPALTGSLNGSYRITAIYRNQYASIPAPYETIGASFDMPVLRTALGSDHVGLGLQLYNDRAGDGDLQNMSILGSVAYHKSLDRFQKYFVSAGIQGGYVQKSLNFPALCFGNQIDPDLGCNPAIANGEPVQDQNFDYFDFNAGLVFTGRFTDEFSMYAGGAFHHFTQPLESFLGSDNRIGSRIVGHAGGEIFLNKQVSLSPSAIFMTQTGATELNLGTAVGYHFLQNSRSKTRTAMYGGLYYRIPHELIFVGSIDYQNFRFGMSYDLTISNLSNANANQGGFEVSVQYIGSLFDAKRKYPLLYCPRF